MNRASGASECFIMLKCPWHYGWSPRPCAASYGNVSGRSQLLGSHVRPSRAGEAKAIRGARDLALPCLASHHSPRTDEMGSEANMLSPSNTHTNTVNSPKHIKTLPTWRHNDIWVVPLNTDAFVFHIFACIYSGANVCFTSEHACC